MRECAVKQVLVIQDDLSPWSGAGADEPNSHGETSMVQLPSDPVMH